jgi:hypothetical protein
MMKKKLSKDKIILNLLIFWIIINGFFIIAIIKIKEFLRIK